MLEKYAPYNIIQKIIAEDSPFTIREIARKAEVGTGTAKQWCDFLIHEGILQKKIIGKRNVLLEKNLEDIRLRYIKILFSLDTVQKSGLVNEIRRVCPLILSIILYGSVARGEDDSKSDIDILIISRKPVHKELLRLKAQEKLEKEVTFTACSMQEWREKAKKDKVFYDQIILEGIALFGDKVMVS